MNLDDADFTSTVHLNFPKSPCCLRTQTNAALQLGPTVINDRYRPYPTAGCWEVTGHYDKDELTFVVGVSPQILGARLYRSVLREYGKAEHPNLIKDGVGKQKVLRVLESAVRGVHRLNDVKKRVDPKMLERLLAKVQAPPLAEIGGPTSWWAPIVFGPMC